MIPREKGFAVQASQLENGRTVLTPFTRELPLPLEDKAITDDISKINSSIKNHVQSYYHADRVDPALIDHNDIFAIATDMPISTGILNTLLENASTREIGLRFSVAWAILSRTRDPRSSKYTLLPPEIARCYQNMSSMDSGRKGRQPNHS